MGGGGAKSKYSGFVGGVGGTGGGTGFGGTAGTGHGNAGGAGVGGGGIGSGATSPGDSANATQSAEKNNLGTGVGGSPGVQSRFERPSGELEQSYKDILESRFALGSEDARRVYDKYVPPGGAVSDGASAHNHYRPTQNDIEMNFAQDNSNRGKEKGSTWFHEHGHYVDANANRPSYDPAFYRAIESDISAHQMDVLQHMTDLGINPSIQEMRNAVRDEMMTGLEKFKTHGVQDIYGGVIQEYNPWSGISSAAGSEMLYGHDWNTYWNRGNRERQVAKEAWAHMFEASFSQEKTAVMQEYFPTAFRWFNNRLTTL